MILLSVNECKWAFKEGDVAVISNPVPESGVVGTRRLSGWFLYCRCFSVYSVILSFICLEGEHEDAGRVAGTIRRYIPIDTRDPHGAILHFYVGDSYDSGRYMLFHMFTF